MKKEHTLYYGLAISIIAVVVLFQWFSGGTPGGTEVGVDQPKVASASVLEGQVPHEHLTPDFIAEDLNGNKIQLSSFRGEKAVILDFWASWCHNCQRSMPQLSKLYEAYNDQVEIIGVNLQESQNKAAAFMHARNIAYPTVLDSNGDVSEAYGVHYTNTHVLLDRDGHFFRIIPGDLSENDILQLIQS